MHLYHYAGNNPVKYVDPDGRSSVQVIEVKMGGYKLSSSEIFNVLIDITHAHGLMGKEYSTSNTNPYVCTTFVNQILSIVGSENVKDYLPGGQLVVDSIAQMGADLIKADTGKNPGEGTYLFYFDYGDGSGHTGFVNFDEDGNAKILHNGGSKNPSVNVTTRSSENGDFKTWFGEEGGDLYYKKLEVEIWTE